MKHPTDMPPDGVMKFFTPDLYQRFNSQDDEVADQANEDWEQALQAYRRHLDSLRSNMPLQVRQLTELCLHDMERLSLNEEASPAVAFGERPLTVTWSALAVLALRQKQQIATLIYFLWDHVRHYESPADWRFSSQPVHWLYDEIDVPPHRPWCFLHRILWSDGQVSEVPFLSVVTQHFPAHGSPVPEGLRKTA